MRSSILAFVFSISIAVVATGYVSHLVIYQKALGKVEKKLEPMQSNSDLIKAVAEVFEDNKDINYDTLKDSLKKLKSENIDIEIADLSSTLNANFMDFTLFKYPPLRNTLAENVTWRTLNDFRQENGFTTDVSIYDKFFKEGENIFTIYSLPNINNAADMVLETFYEEYTGDKFKATMFKNLIVDMRTSQQFLDEKSYNNVMLTFDKDIKKCLGIIPSWNVNFIDEKILKTILSKNYRGQKILSYNGKIAEILEVRKGKLINDQELHNILQLRDKEKAAATFLGTKTTFWNIIVIDKKNKLITKFIYGWIIDEYKLISITTEII